jgi:predicted amidophosphoribosyltransferase
VTSPPRTVDEVAAPYVNFLVRVPSAGPGVCMVCHSIVSAGFRTCYQCGPAVQILGSATADLTAFVSMAPRTEQLARELLTYKNPLIRAEDRQWKTVGLAAVLWKWLGIHEICLINRLGIGGFDLITSVPSTSGRQSHPLRAVVAGVVSGSDKRYVDLLSLVRTDLDQHTQAADRFRATTALDGAHVLVVDDTWTSGANAQSASAALKMAGAQAVAVVTIGRWFNPGYSPVGTDAVSWLADHRKPGWDWQRCCLDPD